MEVQIKDFIETLEQKFWNNMTFAKHPSAAKESVLQTIKAYFLEKDLAIVSRADAEMLKRLAPVIAQANDLAERLKALEAGDE